MSLKHTLLVIFLLLAVIISGCDNTQTGSKTLTAGELVVYSPNFENNGRIPDKYTCVGEDVNPSLIIENIPNETKSLAIIVDDPDAHSKTWVHWVVWNINPTREIKENSVPGTEGLNDFNEHRYRGPCPPKGSGVHRYFFKVYALDAKLDIPINSSKRDLEMAIQPYIIDHAYVVGVFTIN